jgi:hypothetical protein
MSIAALVLVAACADDEGPNPDPGSDTYPGTLLDENVLDDIIPCDIDLPCPDGLSCFDLNLEGGSVRGCFGDQNVCDLVDCGDGTCAIAESYPAQIICSSNDPGDPGDGEGICWPEPCE